MVKERSMVQLPLSVGSSLSLEVRVSTKLLGKLSALVHQSQENICSKGTTPRKGQFQPPNCKSQASPLCSFSSQRVF